MLIVGGELIQASFDVIGDECMYIYIAVDYSRWIVVNICMVDWVICSCIICRVGCISILPLTWYLYHIAVDYDVFVASWGDDLGEVWYHMHIEVMYTRA